MGMVMSQYDIILVNLDPTVGHEMQKARPCVIVSPDELNNQLATLIIVPMTTVSHPYPTRVPVTLDKKSGWIVLDQIRTIDKKRIIKTLGKLNQKEITEIKNIINEMLVQ
ncbi:MAG: type II toxin-antitoxin system PemK/MazF family toxin [Treponema sp.]|nr:type II toxin-antitoxin system PemK/MazF family toxin [Treponema sp.]